MIAPGEHGGDGARLAAALGLPLAAVLDLSASLNPVAPDPAPIVRRHLDALLRYPDPVPATRSLARAMRVDPSRLLLTNGGAEAIALLAAELGAGWIDEPDFSLYRRHLPAIDPAGPRWRSNPHNPSGRLAAPAEHAEVWDEAFWPLATGTWTRGDAGATVIGSLTKLLACPGLRIGYVYSADEELIARLGRRQPRWAVNGLAAASLPELLEGVDLPAWAAQIARLRDQLARMLHAHNLDPQPSSANWLLVHAPGLRYRLAFQGVLVRDCTSFGLPDTVRIAVPDDNGRARLEEALCRG
jgi:histidinol-phosphate/aromatic aminotransferase/cobyric acid decarboxylase-like protein